MILQEFREETSRRGVSLLLTAAVPAGKGNIDRAYEVPELNRWLGCFIPSILIACFW